MLDNAVAQRYASSFFSVATTLGKEEVWKKQLDDIVKSVSNSPFLSKVINYHFISADKKKGMLDKLFKKSTDKQVMNFLYVILDNRRGVYLNLIYEKYIELVRDAQGFTNMEVVTAVDLSDAEKLKLSEALTVREGKRVELSFTVNPKIIGGAIVKSKGKVIDGSLLKKLRPTFLPTIKHTVAIT